MGYLNNTVKGLTWMGSLRAVTRIFAIVKIAIVARLIGPHEFGIFAIASLVLAFNEIITETGINAFLIQEREEIKKYLDTAWMISIVRGLLISILVAVFSVPISRFFNNPESSRIILVISIIPLFRGFINPAIIKFQKEIEFNKEFYLRLGVFTVDAFVSVFLAFTYRSAISLVLGMLAGVLFEMIMSFALVKPTPKLSPDLSKARKVIKRGKWITISGILNYIYKQGDDIVVGRVLSTQILGIYQLAYKISTMPITEIGAVFYTVTFPVFVKIRDDKERLKKAYLKLVYAVSLVTIPFGLFLYLFAETVIRIVLGNEWLSAVPAIKVLSIYGVIRAISGTSSTLFLAIKKQKYSALVVLMGVVGLGIIIIPFVKRFGMVGAGYSALVSWIVTLPLTFYLVKKVLGHDMNDETN